MYRIKKIASLGEGTDVIFLVQDIVFHHYIIILKRIINHYIFKTISTKKKMSFFILL